MEVEAEGEVEVEVEGGGWEGLGLGLVHCSVCRTSSEGISAPGRRYLVVIVRTTSGNSTHN